MNFDKHYKGYLETIMHQSSVAMAPPPTEKGGCGGGLVKDVGKLLFYCSGSAGEMTGF